MFFIGVLASILGNVVIGAGQALQKYALNNLPPSKSRVSSWKWVAGLSSCYIGEFGNMVGITFASPSIVTPLGIISVFTNAILASILLKESLKGNQSGYIWILAGVFLIMFIAPKPSGGKEENLVGFEGVHLVSQWISYINESLFFPFVMLLLGVGFIGGYEAFRSEQGQKSMIFYALIGSSFGSVSILVGKILTHISRIGSDVSLPYPYVLGLAGIIIIAVAGQESMKQLALSQFPVSKMQPQYYAVYNIMVVLTSAIVFQEISGGFNAWSLFFSIFTLGILFIVKGSILIQGGGEDVKNKRFV